MNKEENKETRRCFICQEWFETDKDYISCPAHSFGETTTNEEPLPHPNKMEWEESFDENYDIKNIDEWTLGIVASALTHRDTNPFGSDASHITKKLRSLVNETLTSQLTELEEEIEKMIENVPEVDTNFNDGGDSEYADRRIAIESQKRSAILQTYRSVQALISKKKQQDGRIK